MSAVALVADAKGGTPSLGVRLLSDLRTIFKNHEALSTADILSSLINLEESPWGDLKGKPIDSRRLANLLHPYGIKSKSVRIGEDATPKGYTRESLWDAWARYLVPETFLGDSPIGSATSDTSATDDEPVSMFEEVVDDH